MTKIHYSRKVELYILRNGFQNKQFFLIRNKAGLKIIIKPHIYVQLKIIYITYLKKYFEKIKLNFKFNSLNEKWAITWIDSIIILMLSLLFGFLLTCWLMNHSDTNSLHEHTSLPLHYSKCFYTFDTAYVVLHPLHLACSS